MARPGYRLALIATALAVVVVLLGAYTRLTHAGLGCPDWPGCYGFLAVPMSEHKQNLAALRFPEAYGINVNVLIATGLILFAITLVVNSIARYIVNRRKEFSGAN